MKPAPFQYFAPTRLEEVLTLLAEHGGEAKLLAGGQSLIASLNFRCLEPAAIIDINRVSGLDEITWAEDGGLRIGALSRHRTLEFDPRVAEAVPLLHEAAPLIAHPAIRTRGTMGGSLAYADPAAEWPAVTLALDARYKAARQAGERWIAAEEFFKDMFATALEPDEALVEVSIPPISPRSGWAIVESARRQGDRVMMGVVAGLTLDEAGICREARLVYMNAAPTPVLAPQAAGLLLGEKPSRELFENVGQACQAEINPAGDVHTTPAFQRHLAAELTFRVLEKAAARASGLDKQSQNGGSRHG